MSQEGHLLSNSQPPPKLHPHDRGTVTQRNCSASHGDDLICNKCERIILLDAAHIQNHPCNHVICLLYVICQQIERGTKPLCCPFISCQGQRWFTTSCQYFFSRSPGKIIENTVAGSDDFIEKNLPLDYLIHKHTDRMKRDKRNEGYVLFCGERGSGGLQRGLMTGPIPRACHLLLL